MAVTCSKGTAGYLFWTGQTIYPYGNGTDARIVAPMSKCDTASTPLSWMPTGHALVRLIGSKHELFFTQKDGIRYLGTFRCVSAGQYTPSEFRQLDQTVRV